MLRHLAIVFDAPNNTVRGFIDGALFDSVTLANTGMVASLDCTIGADGYVGFGHRAPGSRGAKMDVQVEMPTLRTGELPCSHSCCRPSATAACGCSCGLRATVCRTCACTWVSLSTPPTSEPSPRATTRCSASASCRTRGTMESSRTRWATAAGMMPPPTEPETLPCLLLSVPAAAACYTAACSSNVSGSVCGGASWYQQRVSKGIDLCRSADVQATCPVACGTNLNCWDGGSSASSGAGGERTLFNRVMLLEAATCLAEGVADPVARCRELRAKGDPRYDAATETTADSTWKGYLQYVRGAGENGRMQDLTDCELLEASINPTCAFEVHPIKLQILITPLLSAPLLHDAALAL